MTWLLEALIQALFNFFAKLIGSGVKNAKDRASNEKRNEEILQHVEKAETPEQIQEALNEASAHIGRTEHP